MTKFTAPFAATNLTLESLASDLLSARDARVTPTVAQLLLALAALVPVDPNAEVPSRHAYMGGGHGRLLPFLLERAPFDRPSQPVRKWPLTIAGFDEKLHAPLEQAVLAEYERCRKAGRYHLQEGAALDVEWLAALLVAAGADPWADASEENPLGCSLQRALEHNQVGLVDRLLAVPGGPDWAQVARQPVWKDAQSLRTRTTWLHAVADRKDDDWAPLLKRLLAHAGPEHDQAPHPLAMASPWALSVYAEENRLPTDSAVIKPIVSQWRARLKSKDLSPEEFSAMEALIVRKELSETTEALFAQKLASMPWGGRFGYSRPEPSGMGVPSLLERTTVKHGALAGQWSHMAVLWVQQIRSFSVRGLSLWPLRSWAHHSVKGYQNGLTPGQLADAIGFDWRPGVRIDGLAMLCVYGTEVDKRDALLGAYRQEIFEENLAALGISDGPAWALQHRDSAVAFTKALVGRGSEKANQQLSSVWSVALERLPGLFDAEPARLVELVRCLAGPDESPWQWLDTRAVKRPGAYRDIVLPDLKDGTEKLSGLLKVLPGEWTNESPPAMEALPPRWRCVAVEAALRMNTPVWLEAVARGAHLLDDATRARVVSWIAVRRPLLDENAADVRVAMMRISEALLEASVISTPETTEPSRRRVRM